MFDEVPLPCDPAVVVPLICAWRACSDELPDHERAKLAVDLLKSWGITTLGASEVCKTVAHLREANFQTEAPLPVDRPPDVLPTDTQCVICGCCHLRMVRRPDVRVWALSPWTTLLGSTSVNPACLKLTASAFHRSGTQGP